MAKYYSTTIQKGSKGDEVSEWQKFLNTQGYNLSVDGDFGDKTYAATYEWQKKNGLGADGIVGENTWSKAGYSASPSSKDWSYKDFSYDDFSYDDYTESDTVKAAGDALNAHLANKPGEYQSQWQGQLDELMNSIMNREKFSYDLNGDALYQQYKDKYIQQGKLAMGDAIGQASAMTGGYGNSYAQTVGQQQYQAQLDNLNDIVPELYQMALDRYNQEGEEMYNQYGMLADRENLDYSRYRDTVSDFLTERDYLAGRYDSERDYDYSKYNNERDFAYGQYSDDRSLAYDEYATDKSLSYQEYRDAIADEQWQKQYDESVRQYNEQMALQKQAASSGGSGGSGGGSGSGNGSGGGTKTAASSGSQVSDTIRQKAASFKSNEALDTYLTNQYNAGNITYEEMASLYSENEISSLSKRDWKLSDDGGINWFWGIDNNAEVTDQYGNKYKLSKLKDALISEGMSNEEAKTYIKNLQKRLGA